jgi:hypothetical protein
MENYGHVEELAARVNGEGLVIESYDHVLHANLGRSHRWEGHYSGLEVSVDKTIGLPGDMVAACMAAKKGEFLKPPVKVRGVFKGHWYDLSSVKGIMDLESSVRHPNMHNGSTPNVVCILAQGHSPDAKAIAAEVYEALFPYENIAFETDAEIPVDGVEEIRQELSQNSLKTA